MFFKEITRGFGVTAQYIVQDPIKLTILWMSSCWIDLIALPHTLAALFPSPCINLTRLLNAESDEQRVDAEVQCCRNPFPRARYRESSHWPPPSWRWLKGRITRSDHCTMWSSGCFICQTSCSTDARYIDVPVKTDTCGNGVIKKRADLIQQVLKIQKLLRWSRVDRYPSELSLMDGFTPATWLVRDVLQLCELFP